MKKTSAQRLSEAICALQMRTYRYCHEMVNSNMRIGICIATRKKPSVHKPTEEVLARLQQQAKSHFAHKNIHLLYFTVIELPVNYNTEEIHASTSLSIDDFLLICRIQEFDTVWEQETLARSLIYCPAELDLGGWYEWFIPEVESVRLAPLCYEWLKEHKITGQIQQDMQQPAISFFDTFIRKHILTDDTMGLSNQERKQIHQGIKDWRVIYKELSTILPVNETTLFDLYMTSRAKVIQSRNGQIRSVLKAFLEEVENVVVNSKPLAQDVKESYIAHLRGDAKRQKQKYEAKRPIYCLSDLECASILYLVIRQFQTDPKKNQVYGEIALFIWICQHAAFSGHELDIDDVLNLKVTSIDFEGLCIDFPCAKIDIIQGLSDIIHCFIGAAQRQNDRKLLPSLTYDNLEKTLKNLTRKIFGREGYLLPKDFLNRVHVIAGARIPYELRSQLTYQKSRVNQSPYVISASEIKKQALETKMKNNP
jgi:hypothetical protein